MRTTEIDEKQRQLLNTLKSMGEGWHTRADIASRLSKRRLNPSEVTVLDMLALLGKLEKTTVPTVQSHIAQWAYRLKEEQTDKE